MTRYREIGTQLEAALAARWAGYGEVPKGARPLFTDEPWAEPCPWVSCRGGRANHVRLRGTEDAGKIACPGDWVVDMDRSGHYEIVRDARFRRRFEEIPEEPPQREATKRHTVSLVVSVEFEGDYYDTNELFGMCETWVDAALDDRSDVTGWKVAGFTTDRTEDDT